MLWLNDSTMWQSKSEKVSGGMAAQYTMPVDDRRIVIKSWTEHSSNHAPLHSLENPSVIFAVGISHNHTI